MHRLCVVLITELAAAAIAIGCVRSSAPGTNSERVAFGLPTATRNDDVLGAEEIAKSIGIHTAADAIGLLRPHFLYRTGRMSPANSVQPKVYLNMQHLGGLEVLARIRVPEIREIRYLGLSDAQIRFGQSINGPIIIVSTW